MNGQVRLSLVSDRPGGAPSESSRWVRVAVPATLVLVALPWVLTRLHAESLHVDESRQIYPYTDGFGPSALQLIQQGQPPLDAVIGSGFVQVLGTSVFVARLPSALWALLAVLAVYFLSRLWLKPAGSLLVGLVLLLNPLFLFYSQYARPYAITLSLFLAGLALALTRKRWPALGALLVVVVLPWTRVVEGGSGSLIVMCVLAWTWWGLSSQPLFRFGSKQIGGRAFAVIGFSLALASSLLGVFSVAGSSGDQYFAPDLKQAARQSAVVMWELGRDQGLGPWLWLFVCVAVLVGAAFASPRMRILALAVVSLPAISILAIIVLASIPVYERYEYFAAPILCLVPLLAADLLRRKKHRVASLSAGIVALGLIAAMLPKSIEVQRGVDFIPYAEIARAQQNFPMAYLVSSDYSIYESADTAPAYQDVPADPRYLPWLTELALASGPAPSHLILIAPIDVLDLKIRSDVRHEYPEGFRVISLNSRDAQGLLEVSRSLPEGAAMKSALAAIRLARLEGDDATAAEARAWVCDLRSRDPWPQALADSSDVLAEFELQPCSVSE